MSRRKNQKLPKSKRASAKRVKSILIKVIAMSVWGRGAAVSAIDPAIATKSPLSSGIKTASARKRAIWQSPAFARIDEFKPVDKVRKGAKSLFWMVLKIEN